MSLSSKPEETTKQAVQKEEFLFFNDIISFSRAVESATGLILDFKSVTDLTTDFIEPSEKYLILNIKGYDSEGADNLLFLTEDKAFLFSRKHPPAASYKPFEKICARHFGRSTVLAFLILNQILDGFTLRLEAFIGSTRELDQNFDYTRYRNLNSDFERFYDRLEEFHGLLLKLQQRGYRQIETRYISFDYNVLIAESLSLQGRCRRRLNMLKEVARDYEIRVTTELNKRIERLNDVVKRLTAITVILMLPTLIASHFGMNFQYMPELRIWWAYLAVIGAQLAIMVAGIIIFKKIDWL